MTLKNNYKILYLEAETAQAALVRKELTKSKFDFELEVVENEADFKKSLTSFFPDIILCDHALPLFNCFDSLRYLKTNNYKIPVIALSATMTEAFAIAIVKEGAADYILKDRLQRLPFAAINAYEKYHFENDCNELIDEVNTKESLLNESLKQSEEKLIAALKNLKKIMDSSLDIICTVDENGKFVTVSKAAFLILGYTPQQMEGVAYTEFIYKEDRERTKEVKENIIGKKTLLSFENRYVHKNGSLVNLLWSANYDVKEKLTYCIAKDTTQKEKLSNALENERQHFKELFLQAPTSMGILNGPTHIFESANEPYLQLIGKKNIFGKTVAEVLPEIIEQGFIDLLDAVYKTGETFTANEMLIKFDLHNDGNLTDKYLNFIYQAYKNSDGVIAGIFFFAVDVTEQVLSRIKIEYSENRFREIFNTIPEALVIIDAATLKFISFNETALLKLNYTEEAFLQKGALEISPAYQKDGIPSSEKASQYLSEVLAGGKPIFEWVFLDADGNEIWCEVRLSLIYNDEKPELLSSISDITERKKNEQQMRELNDRLLLATESAGMGIWNWDFKNDHIVWDERMFEIYKIKPGDFESIYDAWLSVLHPEDVDLVNHETQMAIRDEKNYDLEFRIIGGDASIKYIKATGITERDNEGNITRLIGVNWDITKQKEKELQLTLMESVITNTTDSVIITEAEPFDEPGNKIIYVNDAFTKMTGYTADEVIGKTPRILQGPKSDKEELKRLSKSLREWKNYETTMINYKKNGEEFWVEFSVSPVADDKGWFTHWISIEKDVTERKLSELKLIELNENLQKHTKELALSNAELQQFAYVASHDLQEPLRMITSFLTLLEKRYGDIIDDRGKKYINFAVDGAKRMRQIILDLLDFSRAGTTEEAREELDLNALINEIKILYRKKIDEKKAVIKVDALPKILANRSPVRQVFQNLIANALTYAKKEIPVEIKITVKDFDDYWQFAVQDNGIGIEKEYFEKIFIIFQRLHNKDEYSGTGMGLAIAKKIIETMGGKIWLTSEVDKGSIFYLTIKKEK